MTGETRDVAGGRGAFDKGRYADGALCLCHMSRPMEAALGRGGGQHGHRALIGCGSSGRARTALRPLRRRPVSPTRDCAGTTTGSRVASRRSPTRAMSPGWSGTRPTTSPATSNPATPKPGRCPQPRAGPRRFPGLTTTSPWLRSQRRRSQRPADLHLCPSRGYPSAGASGSRRYRGFAHDCKAEARASRAFAGLAHAFRSGRRAPYAPGTGKERLPPAGIRRSSPPAEVISSLTVRAGLGRGAGSLKICFRSRRPR